MVKICLKIFAVSVLFLNFQNLALAGDESLLADLNGDGSVSMLAFGDSITYGIGDIFDAGANVETMPAGQPPGGYPKRIASLTSIPVSNAGLPGEEFVLEGAQRFAKVIQASKADLVLFLEGANDAVQQIDPTSYRNKLQRIINSSQALGKTPIILTIPPSCCNHDGQRLFTSSYNQQIGRIQSVNEIRVADTAHAWETTCVNRKECELLNVPEGLHPNKKGYTVIAQTVLATIYGIDIFSPNGASELAGALGVDPTEIIVKPDAQPEGNEEASE